MKHIKDISQCFDKHGNFVVKYFDPYRGGTDDPKEEVLSQRIYDFLFDESGCAIKASEVFHLINKNGWGPICDATMYYYSHYIDTGCKGNYTAIYAWR